MLGSVAMGKAVVSTSKRSLVRVTVPGMPAGLVLTLVRGQVDLTGADRVPTTLVRTRLTVTDGVAKTYASTDLNCYLRVEARTTAGDLVAFANPVWVLKAAPRAGIPAARRP